MNKVLLIFCLIFITVFGKAETIRAEIEFWLNFEKSTIDDLELSIKSEGKTIPFRIQNDSIYIDSVGSDLSIHVTFNGQTTEFVNYGIQSLQNGSKMIFGLLQDFKKLKKKFYKKHKLLKRSQSDYNKLLNKYPYLITAQSYPMEIYNDVIYCLYSNGKGTFRFWNSMTQYPTNQIK